LKRTQQQEKPGKESSVGEPDIQSMESLKLQSKEDRSEAASGDIVGTVALEKAAST